VGLVSVERFERHLRWYPAEWRARYGAELVALMEDAYGPGGAPPAKDRFAMVRAGLAERLGRSPLAGSGGSPERVRSGCLLVLCGWSLFVVAGAGFAKLSEHWESAVPNGDRLLPTGAFDTVQTAATIGVGIVALAALAALPPFVRLLRRRGWPEVRVPILAAAAACGVASVATAGAVIWSHIRPAPLRAGPVPVAGIGWALLVVAAIGVSTLAVVVVVSRLEFSVRALRLESVLAAGMTLVMCAVLGGTVLWWGALVTDAPGFVSGGGGGLFGASGTLSLGAAGSLMVVGLALGLWGDTRMLCARHSLAR
jgi:hypothetical protein